MHRLMEFVRTELAAFLRQLRLAQGFSLNGLARRAGLSRQMLSKVETRRRRPTFETVLQLALAMEYALTKFVNELWAKIRAAAGHPA